VDEAEEERIEFLEAREDAPEALEPPEQALDLVAPLVHLPVAHSGFTPGLERRNHGREAEIERQLTCLVALVGAVHHQCRTGVGPCGRTVSCGRFDRLAATALCWKRPSRDRVSTTSGSRNRGHARRLGDKPKVRVFGSPSEGGLWSPPKAEGLAFGAFVCAAASLTRHLTGQPQRAGVDRPDLLQRVA